MTKRLIVFEKTTTTVFIYLTITGVAMLNASPFHQMMLVNDLLLPLFVRWRHSFSLRANNHGQNIDKFEKNNNLCFIYVTILPASHFPLINRIFFYGLYVFTALRHSFYHYASRLGLPHSRFSLVRSVK